MLSFLKRTLRHYGLIASVPKHLIPNGRDADQSFQDNCKLYHGYELHDISPTDGQILTETIRFPDFSCNWNKYSEPEDVRYRVEGRENDGCYSVTVKVVRFDDLATPVHDPLNVKPWYNYSHTEVRALRKGKNQDPKSFVPPKKKPLGGSKAVKLKYRENLVLNALIEIKPNLIKSSGSLL